MQQLTNAECWLAEWQVNETNNVEKCSENYMIILRRWERLSSGILGRQCTVLINNLTYYQNSPMSIQMTSVPLGPELTYPSKQAQEWLPGLLIHFWEQSPLFTWHSLMSWQVRPSSFKENPAGHEQWNDPSVFAQEYSQSPFPLFLAHSFMSTQFRDLVRNQIKISFYQLFRSFTFNQLF